MPPTNEIDLWILPKLFLGLMIFFRTGGLLCLLPTPGLKELPRQIRVYGAAAISFFMTIVFWQTPVSLPDNIISGALMLASELLLGLFFSAVLLIFFSALTMAGDLISRLSGLSLATVFDPNWGDSIPVLSHFLLLLGIAIFLVTGGLEQFSVGFLDSFQTIPPGRVPSMLWESQLPVEILRISTVLAIRISVPVILAALTVFVTAGIVGRMVPQINVMLISFNGSTLLIFAVLAVTIGFGLRIFQEYIARLSQTIFLAQ